MKIRLMQVLWVAMVLQFFGFVVFGFSVGEGAQLLAPLMGAVIAGVGFSIVYVFTGSFKRPK